MANQEEDPIERLARRTAEENDRLARQRLDEMFNPQKHWTQEQRERNKPSIHLLIGLFVLVAGIGIMLAH